MKACHLMKLAIMQPYFFPYIGYFQLINSVGTFVIYDDVNYIKQGWINRNRILLNNTDYMLSLRLAGASSFKLINEIQTGDNKGKLLKTISQAYAKAPFYGDSISVIEDALSNNESNLARFVARSIVLVSEYLQIKARFLLSSEIAKNNSLKADDKVIHICNILGAKHYINASGGTELYSKQKFMDAGIKLEFIKSKPITYKQFNNNLVPWLSIIDVMMFNSKEAIIDMLNQYDLV